MRAITQIDAAADDRSSAMTISKIARRQTHQQSLERTSNHRKKSRSACASFPALIAVASGLIATTAMRTILVVGVDMIHKLTEPATLAAFCGATEPARLSWRAATTQVSLAQPSKPTALMRQAGAIPAGGTFEPASIEAVKAAERRCGVP